MAVFKLLPVVLALLVSSVLVQGQQCQCPGGFIEKLKEPEEGAVTFYQVVDGVAVGGQDISELEKKDREIAELQLERDNYLAWYNAIRKYVSSLLLSMLLLSVRSFRSNQLKYFCFIITGVSPM